MIEAREKEWYKSGTKEPELSSFPSFFLKIF
jgi:hypothetical protein